MRTELLGLPLNEALRRLKIEGREPEVVITSAPKRRDNPEGKLRVVNVADDGSRITASRFLDPFDKAL